MGGRTELAPVCVDRPQAALRFDAARLAEDLMVPLRRQRNGALGEIRGVFGVDIARPAASPGLDVEDELASLLPAPDEVPREAANHSANGRDQGNFDEIILRLLCGAVKSPSSVHVASE